MEKEKFNQIIEDMKEVRTQTKTKVSDEILFQMATDIYISEYIQTNKQGGNSPTSFDSNSSPATKPQINTIKKLSIRYPELKNIDLDKLTKKEAMRIIGEKFG